VHADLGIPAFFGVLALLVFTAHVGGVLAVRLRLPSVVGELLAGVVLAAIPSDFVHSLRHELLPNACAELGMLLLLFDIGLELRPADLHRIGVAAFRVAALGVLASVVLVGGASFLLGATRSFPGHLFVGATLAATSIGITGRVLREFGRTQSPEGKAVLAAAVLDDVLGLLLLAFVSAWVGARAGASNSELGGATLALMAARALGFLVLAVLFGRLVLPRLFSLLSRVAGETALLVFGLAICLFYAWAANLAGLAPAIGAFLAGLVIVPEDYRPLVQRPGDTLEALAAPLLAFFVPMFFLLAGLKVDLRAFLDPHVWLLSAVFIVACVLGKLSAGLGAPRGSSRLVVGLSMIPRGEVSLIFATAGMSLADGDAPVIGATTFNAVVITVIATALVPPFALRRAFARDRRTVPPGPRVVREREAIGAHAREAQPEDGA
jgi:Kef-type K+ transport system membrane component KefB